MGGRRAPRLGRLSAAVLLACAAACGSGGAAPPLGPGASAPAFWADDGTGRPVLGWVLRGDDLLGCRTAASELRAVQRRHGRALRLSLVYVGDDPAWVEPFIRRERLDAEVVALGRAEARRTLGAVGVPAFVAARGGVVVRVATSAPDPAGGSDRGLALVLGSLFRTAASWSGAGP